MRMLVLFIYLCLSISSFPAARGVLSGSLQEHNLGSSGAKKHDIVRVNGDEDQNRTSGITQGSKYGHGAGSAGERGAGNGNGNGESNGASGAATTPVVVAGAASNHHPNSRRNAASCNKNCIRLPTLIVLIFASIAMHV